MSPCMNADWTENLALSNLSFEASVSKTYRFIVIVNMMNASKSAHVSGTSIPEDDIIDVHNFVRRTTGGASSPQAAYALLCCAASSADNYKNNTR